jgi:hypothetical protein
LRGRRIVLVRKKGEALGRIEAKDAAEAVRLAGARGRARHDQAAAEQPPGAEAQGGMTQKKSRRR